jgi:chromosome segregation ATPase
MTIENVIALAAAVLGGTWLGTLLQHRRERNKPKIDAAAAEVTEAQATDQIVKTVITQAEYIREDLSRIRAEREEALNQRNAAQIEVAALKKQIEALTDKYEASQAFVKVIGEASEQAKKNAMEYHERAVQADAEARALREEVVALRQRVIEEKAGVAALGVELMRQQQTGPLSIVKSNTANG